MGKAKTVMVTGLALVCLAGCRDDRTATPVKLDQRLSGIYERTCRTCHETPETGAPQTHDLEQWKPRLAQGDAVLLDHIVNGYRGMPPLGQCIECSADDLTTLMRFMSGPASQ